MKRLKSGASGRVFVLGLSIIGLTAADSSTAFAQTDHDFQAWNALLSTAKVGGPDSRFRLWFDGHVRRGEAGTTIIVRPAVGYAVNAWASVWLGYAWVPVIADEGGEVVHEHRIWQQLTLSPSFMNGQLKAQARTRFEQRISEVDDKLGFRVRQFVRASYRFSDDSRWGLAVWDELFVGLNEVAFAPQGYDQNRIFVGPAVHAFDGLRLEFGYLFVHLRRPPANRFQHVLALNFFVSL